MSNRRIRNELQRLMLGDALGDMAGFLDNIIDKLDVDGLEDEVLERGDESRENNRDARVKRKRSISDEDMEEEQKVDEGRDKLGDAEVDGEDDEIQSDKNSFKADHESSQQSSSPIKGENGQAQEDRGVERQQLQPPKRQVHFSPTSESTTAAQAGFKGVKLPTLYSNERQGEIVYRLTELYLPDSESHLKRRVEFNQDLMFGANYFNNEHQMQLYKRKIKSDLQQCRRKIKHQIKYCQVPAAQMEETMYRYKAGMTSRDLARMKAGNRYENAPHIGRIVPAKRHAMITDAISQQKVNNPDKYQQQREEEIKIKDYSAEGQEVLKMAETDSKLLEIAKSVKEALGIQNMLTQKDLNKEQVDELFESATQTRPETLDKSMESQEEQKLQKVPLEKSIPDIDNIFTSILKKMRSQNLSISQLSTEERKTIKSYVNLQAKNLVNSKYPAEIKGLSEVQKLCYVFMKNLDQKSFAYRGAPSKLLSDENNDELPLRGEGEDGIYDDVPYINNFIQQNISNISTSSRQGHLSQNGGQDYLEYRENNFGLENHNMPDSQRNRRLVDQGHTFNGVNDIQIYQWYQDQKLQEATKGTGYKRRKYWGEPADCSSHQQISSENWIYSKHLAQSKPQKENLIFTFEINSKQQQANSNQKPNVSAGKPQFTAPTQSLDKKSQSVISMPIKDLKEYEFFQKQRDLFYNDNLQSKVSQDDQKDRKLNSIIRHLKFQMGEISAEEFYAQESLDYQQQMSQDPQKSGIQGPGFDASTKLKKFHTNPALADQHAENFDLHFELTKKERHDRMMARLQQQEKQNQPQSANGQTTIAYASGQDVLKKVIGSTNNLDSKRGGGDKFEKNLDDHEEADDEQFAENHPDGLGQGTNASKQQQQADSGITAEDNMRLRVTKSRANELNHAKCILKLTYTKFEWSDHELLNFHRPNIQEVMQIRSYSQRMGNCPSMNVRVLTNEQIEKRSKKIGINAHEYFKDRFKLSLKDGRFCLFEHIDQKPLFVNNFGMASKLKRYVYADEMLPHHAFTRKPENAGLKHMGPYGVQVLKKKGEKIPLLGQIDPRQYRGLTVLENNMYYCPVFYHKTNRNNFLCVVHQDKHGNNQIFVRELQEMYLMGQIEPKSNIEVYNPQSRQYQHFIKKRTQAYVIRFLQENENRISFTELNKYFSYINDQILKKIIKDINVEVDRLQMCSLAQDYKDEQFKSLITPENICQYESALYGEHVLKIVGIRDITNADKISYATNKFCSEETDLKKQLIARIIEEEVLSTPWNLSQNFNHNRQQKGMMMLEGIGDPSNGHGGYSYLKLPLKISQDSLNKAKINRMYLNPAIQNPKAVTGTDADLRKLSKQDIQQKLQDLGFKKDSIKEFSRWQMVALLRDKSSQAVTQGIEGENKKFARGVRFTSKKQREMYQKQVNDIFKKQIHYLQQESGDAFNDLSDVESKDQRQKKFKEMQQINSNNSKSIVELKEDIEVKKIQDIPGYEILVLNNAAQGTVAPGGAPPAHPGISGAISSMNVFQGYENLEQARKALRDKMADGLTLECTILRKKIKPVGGNANDNNENAKKIERVIFCSDMRQIKGFKKRKHKHEVKTKRTKKTSLKEKMHSSKPMMVGNLSDLRGSGTGGIGENRRSETQSRLSGNRPSSNNRMETSPVKIKIGTTQPKQFQEPASIKIPTSVGSLTNNQPMSSKFSTNLSNLAYNQYGQLLPQPIDGSVSSIKDFSSSTIRLGVPSATSTVDYHRQQTFGAQDYPQSGGVPKIQISLGGLVGPTNPVSSGKFYEEEKKSLSSKQKTSSKSSHIDLGKSKIPSNPSKPASKPLRASSSIDLADDEYEKNLYKPRYVQPSRRRQKSEEALLNEIFENVIDSCFKQDSDRIFHAPVREKDAPNYNTIIKNPIDLGLMRGKAKRGEYYSRDEIMVDFELLRFNAETFNGTISDIAEKARKLVEHAGRKLDEQDAEILNLESLVREKLETGLLTRK